MSVEVDDRAECGVDGNEVAAAVAAVLHAEGVGEVEVGVVLVDEHEMRDINREHRGKDEPTDVLSFPIDEEDDLEGVTRMLGDVVICIPVLVAQARDSDVAAGDELVDLLVHGTLHLLGYDHETDDGEMLARQDAIVATLAPIGWSAD
ncbi:MAG: rRNA maturation RNase YbeY [Gaiellales bacterium]